MKIFNGIRSILSLLVSSFIIVISFFIIIFCTITSFLKEENLKSIINADLVLNIKYENESINDLLFKNNKLDKKMLDDVVSSTEFKDFFDLVIDESIDYYIYDKSYPNFDEKYEIFVYDVSKNLNSEEIKDVLLEEKDIFKIPEKEKIFGSEYIYVINSFDFFYVYYFCGFILVFMFLIFIFNWSLLKPFKYAGTSFIISSLMCISLYFCKSLFLKDKIFSDFIIIISNIFDLLLKYSIICLSVGILFIIIFVFLNKINSRQNSLGDVDGIN